VIFTFKQVIYNELPYVAKRCYTLGNGTPVSIIANRNELIKEATTLGRAKFFLANFKDECEYQDINISGKPILCFKCGSFKLGFYRFRGHRLHNCP
jgi:hypothetical protein